MIKLTITEKGGEPRSLTFDKDEISIGRVSGNDVVLPKGNISKRHSRLNVRDGILELSDLKSTNGTYLNGRKIAEPIVLSLTDRIQVGDFVITMDSEGAGSHGGAGSAARALPVPPPPPPPRGASGLSGLPPLPDEGTAGEEEDDSGYGSMRSRSGRIPIPPPPPPPRRATAPTSPLGLEDDGVDIGGDMAPPSLSDVAPAGEETGHGGATLFGGGRETAYDDASRPVDGDRMDDDGAQVQVDDAGDDLGVSLPPEAGSPSHLADLSLTGRASDADDLAAEQEAAEGGEEAGTESPLEPLDALLADPTVTQIIITGTTTALVERHGKLEPLAGGLGDPEAVAEALWRLANTATPPPPPDNPVVDVRLADGTRIAAVFPPASLTGVCGSIRKAALPDQSLADMAAAGGLVKEAQTIIESAIASQRNLVVTGDAGSVGALVGAIAAGIPATRRVVSLGAALPQPREGWVELAPVGDLPGLVRVAAALRADHLVVGEVMGAEVLDILLAAAHGQEGILLGLTARSSAEALIRVEALAAQIPGAAGVASLANSTLDLVIQAAAPTDGGVRVVEIAEVKLDAAGHLTADPVLLWRSEGSRRAAGGKAQVLGISSRLASAMASSGSALPSNLIRK